ncbi:hypothetical protein AYO38_02145 [bacterium SCGC AG-212-C10]|nr:hypothetical protein AYO38_02145 [bacterium SCGC AG-212-C10]
MASGGVAVRGGALVPGKDGPAFIAHGGGNKADLLHQALDAKADFVEIDLWVNHGRFEARHERSVFGTPLWFERWYLRWAPRHSFRLASLLRDTAGRTEIFFDFKNSDARSARLLGEALDEAGPDIHPVASSQLWHVLRVIQRTAPAVRLFYSIDVKAQLDLFLSVADRDVRPSGVSCRHSLLSREIIARLHDRGLLVVAWTVDDEDRGAELAEWGIDGITTHRVKELRQRIVGE